MMARAAAPVATRIGAALVLHEPGGASPGARSLADAAPEADGLEVVVLDVSGGLEHHLPAADARELLVVPSENADLQAVRNAESLARHRNQAVTFPDGPVLADSGALFVPPDGPRGWVRSEPHGVTRSVGRRLPVPRWNSLVTLPPAGFDGHVEQVPAGIWIKPQAEPVDSPARALARRVAFCPDRLTVLLGCPGRPPVAIGDVVRWWSSVPPSGRSAVRFVVLGPVGRATGQPVGQVLADVLREEVVCLTGVPLHGLTGRVVRAQLQDGALGRLLHAEELAWRPAGGLPAVAVPEVRAVRTPVPWLPEMRPGVHRYADGVEVEVVQAGLWVRPSGESAPASDVRCRPIDAAVLAVFHESSDSAEGRRLRHAAHDLAAVVADREQVRTAVVAIAAPSPGRESFPLLSRLLNARVEVEPAPALQTEPHPRVSARPTAQGVAAEDRAVLRREWFGAEAEDEALDTAALQLYLAGRDPDVDAGLRAGADGPHVAFARCAAAALARLTPHRGPVASPCTPSEAQWDLCSTGVELTEWGFLTLLSERRAEDPQTTDLVVWSMTGRRTGPLELDPRAACRVLFTPGTRFRVLGADRPRPGGRGLLLVRELAASEAGAAAHPQLDELTRRALLRFVETWARTDDLPGLPGAVSARLGHLPGFVT